MSEESILQPSTTLVLNTVFLTVLVYYLYWYLTRNFNYWKDQSIPYLKPVPIIGNFFKVITLKRNIGHFLADLHNEVNKPYFGIFVFGTPTLIVSCPDLIKNILQNDFDYFSNRNVHCDTDNKSIESKMLFFQRDNNWKESRKRLTGAFTSAKLKGMVPLINESAKQMVRYLEVQKQDMEIKRVCLRFTTSVIASCLFGLEVDSFCDDDNGFVNASAAMFQMDLSNIVRSLSYFFFHNFVKIFKFSFIKPKVIDFLTHSLNQTLQLREKTKMKRHDLVDILLQIKTDFKKENENSDFDDMKIISQAMQFYIAGFETNSSTIAFTLYELSINKQIQDKLRQEIVNITSKSEEITYENVLDMKYLHQCISETLRKYPVLPFLDRRCMRDYSIPNGSGHVIKCGTPVYIPLFGLHYDPQYFPEPEKYDPERFSPSSEEQQQRHPFSYLPFGHGPHNCIGERFGLLTTKMGVIHIIQKYELERNEATPVPIVFESKSLILQSNVGLPMRLIKCK